MGQSKGTANYDKLSTVTPEVETFLQGQLKKAGLSQDQAAQAYQEFLGQMGGANPIVDAANKNFQQQTVPGILNAYGTGNKGSSSLNQALAAGAANLNTDLAGGLAELKLKAAQGLSNLSSEQGRVGSQTPTFDYQQKAPPIWQQALLGTIQGGSKVLSSYLGK